MADCFECKTKLGWNALKTSGKTMKEVQQMVGFSDEVLDKINDKDVLCNDCNYKLSLRHALEMYNYNKKNISEKDWEIYRTHPDTISIVQEAERLLAEQGSSSTTGSSSMGGTTLATGGATPAIPVTGGATPATGGVTLATGGAIPASNATVSTANTVSTIQNLSNFTSAEQLREMTKSLHDQTKANWEKNGVVQYKDEGLVILQRMWGQQVQFIVACAQITKEGYRLMAIDEGKEGSSGGFSGGVNAYFYFQKMDFVR